MPAGGMGYEVDCSDAKNRIGSILGGEVLKVASGIRTHLTRGDRTQLGSLSKISLWPWIAVEGRSSVAMGAIEETVSLKYIEMPSIDEALRNQEVQHEALRDARDRGARDAEINVATRFADWSDKLVAAIQSNQESIDISIQALRIDGMALVGLSVESFFETGLTIKGRSPFPHTQVLGYTNGCVCYLPRAEDYPPGGWDWKERYGVPDMLFQAYSIPVAIRPDSERLVTDKATALLEQLV